MLVTEVTEEVVLPEMFEQLVLVVVARVAELTQRVALVRPVVRVSDTPVSG